MRNPNQTIDVVKEEHRELIQPPSNLYGIIKKEELHQIKQENLITKKEEENRNNYCLKQEENKIFDFVRVSNGQNIFNGYDYSSSSEDLELVKKRKNFSKKRKVKGATSAKNVIKNYGRALQNFAVSNMCLPYIRPILERESATLVGFRGYLSPKKKEVRSIAGLRSLLLISESDNVETAKYKKVFQELSIIFIKYFSVNWIFSGKLLNKIAHLKCRFKMLRRIRDPENFTYLKGFI